ncbi:regulatory protein RecX [Stackebrandtia nassauensis]|uniref:Regulatory protein RecX n=1 Tax=Stackebrandtia nassauensis (strain DSM 44728 / CIP 108903 / NRRL B-16338 / NBRC 102104 / LLR-40K-21) TaxID=446470 RepID=D3Q299_STANL|nr:regulatory protein RecX [Stackebrandtia nassauensis]ADD43832.1 regulatory protein RecX [Stackebrandtia nassauensis DSM 44728]
MRDSKRSAKAEPPKDPAERAREICLRLLDVRPRTYIELAEALTKKDIPDDIIAEVLDRYREVGMVDDAAFARAWVSSRHRSKKLSRRALSSELRRKGVDTELVDEALEQVDGDSEREAARALVEKRLRSMGSVPPDAVFRRLVSMLARKGYPAGVAVGVVKDILAEQAETAELAEQIDVDAMSGEAEAETST